MTPTILGRLHGIRNIGIAGFEVPWGLLAPRNQNSPQEMGLGGSQVVKHQSGLQELGLSGGMGLFLVVRS
jgi:hypothetical protein